MPRLICIEHVHGDGRFVDEITYSYHWVDVGEDGELPDTIKAAETLPLGPRPVYSRSGDLLIRVDSE